MKNYDFDLEDIKKEIIRMSRIQYTSDIGSSNIIHRIIGILLFYYCISEKISYKYNKLESNFIGSISHVGYMRKKDFFNNNKRNVIYLLWEDERSEYDERAFFQKVKETNYGNIFILYLIRPLEKREKERKRRDYMEILNLESCKLWDFSDLKPIFWEYSRFISGYSELFNKIALNYVIRLDPSYERNKRKLHREKYIEIIGKLNKNNLILFLGSGVSKSLNCPDWNELLKKLMRRVIEDIPESKGITENEKSYFAGRFHDCEEESPLIEAEFIKIAIVNDLRTTLFDILQSKKRKQTSKLIQSIQSLCGSELTNKIITYNFDDLMDKALKQSILLPAKDIKIISNEKNYDLNELTPKKYAYYNQKRDNNMFYIYHVHGLLKNKNSKIILTESDYLSLRENGNLWRNKCQTEAFDNYNCLLIGLSLKDPNLRSLMYSSFHKWENKIDEFTDIKHEKNLELWRDGLQHFAFIQRISVDKFLTKWKERYKKLKETKDILERYHAIKEILYNQLGVNVIWYDNYNEIPKLLDEIVKKASS